jgi:hypothetical protein
MNIPENHEGEFFDYTRAVERFASAHAQIGILRRELTNVQPSIWPAVLGFQLAMVLLLAAVAVALTPYFLTGFPQTVAAVAAFAAVPLAFLAYSTLGRATTQFRLRQRHRRVLVKVLTVAEAADEAWSGARHLVAEEASVMRRGSLEAGREA